jgi:hypothetical protein
MSTPLVTNSGLDYLDSVDVDTDCSTWQVACYVNNRTPSSTDTLVSYTLSTIPGIGNQTPGFTVAAATGGAKTITSNLMNFISTAASAQTIYGAVLMGTGGSVLIAACLFTTPISIPAAGNGCQVTWVHTDSNS